MYHFVPIWPILYQIWCPRWSVIRVTDVIFPTKYDQIVNISEKSWSFKISKPKNKKNVPLSANLTEYERKTAIADKSWDLMHKQSVSIILSLIVNGNQCKSLPYSIKEICIPEYYFVLYCFFFLIYSKITRRNIILTNELPPFTNLSQHVLEKIESNN